MPPTKQSNINLLITPLKKITILDGLWRIIHNKEGLDKQSKRKLHRNIQKLLKNPIFFCGNDHIKRSFLIEHLRKR